MNCQVSTVPLLSIACCVGHGIVVWLFVGRVQSEEGLYWDGGAYEELCVKTRLAKEAFTRVQMAGERRHGCCRLRRFIVGQVEIVWVVGWSGGGVVEGEEAWRGMFFPN